MEFHRIEKFKLIFYQINHLKIYMLYLQEIKLKHDLIPNHHLSFKGYVNFNFNFYSVLKVYDAYKNAVNQGIAL